MTSLTQNVQSDTENGQPVPFRQAAIYVLSAVSVVLLVTMSPAYLNTLTTYSIPGGSFFSKFHPASYVGVILFALTVADSRRDKPLDRHLLVAGAALASIVTWLAWVGKGALAATIIDIHLVPALLCLAMSRLSLAQVQRMAGIFVWIALANVVIVAFEAGLRSTLLPITQSARYFRPAGLFGHPIMAGTLFYCAMFLITRGILPRGIRRAALLVLLLGIALCGVRGPLFVGLAIIAWSIIQPYGERRTSSTMMFNLGVLSILSIGALMATAGGAFDRILEFGLWEESAQSRFSIFGALDLLSPYQFWNGVDGYDVGAYLALQTTGGRLVENAFISVLLQAGAGVATLLLAAIAFIYWPAMRSSAIFFLIVAAVAVTTIGFGVKSPISAAVMITGFVIWRQALEPRTRLDTLA